MKKDSLFKGTFILSISLILTKIIGLIYIIPYYQIIGGDKNMILFNYAYPYYVLLLEISSAGIPLTMSKLISKYNAEKNFAKSRQVAKIGSTILLIGGIIGFLFFFFGSNFLAAQTISEKGLNYTVDELSLVLKTLSFAIPFVMISSGFRGVFQGHEIMIPSAYSQFFEQLVRVFAMLIGAYLVMKYTRNIVYTNAISTFATVVGAIVAVLILIYYYKKINDSLEFNNLGSNYFTLESNLSVAKEIILVAIPFVAVSSFFSILTVIDQNTIVDAMAILGKARQGEEEYNIYSGLVNKVVMIAVSLAPAFTGAFLPSVTRLYTEKNIEGVSEQTNKVLLALLMLVVPALVGMYILAEPLYVSFYEPKEVGYELLRVYLPLSLVYSIYGITGIIMQAIEKQTINIITLVIGIIFKLVLNESFIVRFETKGAIYCSILTYILMIYLNVMVINFNIKIRFKEFFVNLLKILVASFIMFILVSSLLDSIVSNIPAYNKMNSVVVLFFGGILGGITYFYSLNKLKFLNYLFNRNFSLRLMLRRK